MAPPSNVEAVAFILDICQSSSEATESGNSFLNEAVSCMTRVVERKIFSRPGDLLSLILLGSEESNNGMYEKGKPTYQHISIATKLEPATWNLVELIQNKLKLSNSTGDWVDALVVAADYIVSTLKEEGTKTSSKKIVLLTDFKTKTTFELDQLQEVMDGFREGGIELIFIGSSILDGPEDLLTDEQEYNLKILSHVVKELDANKVSFEEVQSELKFYKKKAVNLRPWNVDLCIGSEIKIPISGYGRIRNEPPVKIPWTKVFSQPESHDKESTASNLVAVEKKKWYSDGFGSDFVSKEDTISAYSYGGEIIPFTELEQRMNYQSGERGLICYGFTKNDNINFSHLTDNGVTYVVSRAGNHNASAALEALALALKQNDLVLIARKVYNKNNAPRMVALFPIIKKSCKYLSMITLAFREDHRHMLLPSLSKKKYTPSEEQLAAVDELIKAMDLGEGFSIKSNVNPTLQYTYDSLAHKALNPGKPLPGPRPEVQKLIETSSVVAKLSVEPLQKIKDLFPMVTIEKTSGRKKWTDEHLLADDKKEDVKKLPDTNDLPAASVLSNAITKVGTVNPAQDFELLSWSNLPKACQELKEVVESLVTLSFSEDYSKPIAALKEMRKACVPQDPSLYNDWLPKFKETLLDKLKSNFLVELFKNNLGLITNNEDPKSSITEEFARKFEHFNINESITKPEMDDVGDLFD